MSASSGQFLKMFCVVCQIVAALCPTFEKLLVAEKFGVGRERSQRVKKVFEIDLWLFIRKWIGLRMRWKPWNTRTDFWRENFERQRTRRRRPRRPSCRLLSTNSGLIKYEHYFWMHCQRHEWHRMAIQPTPQPIIRVFCGKIIVVYFDQRLGAAHSNCWSK